MSRLIIASLALGSLTFMGCQTETRLPGPRTEGDRMVLEGKLMQERGQMMQDGEAMVAKGQGMKAEGDAKSKQGQDIAGARQSREGEEMIKMGQVKIDQAKAMKTDVTDAPATTPMR